MTLPTPHGYPDFGRFIAGADKVIANIVDNAMNAPRDFGPFFVGDVPYVRFLFRAFTFNFDVAVAFAEDEAFTISLGTEFWTTNMLDTFNQTIPALGPFMRITVAPSAFPASMSLKAIAAHEMWRPSNGGIIGTLPFDGVAVAYPAGITNLDAIYILPGPGVFFGECTAGNCRMNLQAIDAAGGAHLLIRIRDLEGQVTRPFFAPPAHLRLQIDNGSGAPANFTYSVMTQYGGVH